MSAEVLVPHWDAPDRVRAAFSLRSGGVSAAPYDSLNLAIHVGDAPGAVRENRRRLEARLGLPSEPLWLDQCHGIEVVDADGIAATPLAPRADAAVTRRPGRVLAILVADCVPVLLACIDGSAIAVAHAGWRGLAGGVLEAAVATLRAAPGAAAGLCAWLGPGIGPARFEVGREVRAAFLAQDPAAAAAFRPNERGRWLCDLHALARARLAALGVPAVQADPSCTASDARRFYSYRREGVTGRMAALAWITP